MFNHLSAPPERPWTPWDLTLADMMSSYCVNFAKNGNPNGPGLPQWPAYNEQADLLMHFGDKVTAEQSPLKSDRDAARSPYPRRLASAVNSGAITLNCCFDRPLSLKELSRQSSVALYHYKNLSPRYHFVQIARKPCLRREW